MRDSRALKELLAGRLGPIHIIGITLTNHASTLTNQPLTT